MAVFERERSSRRFFSLSSDPFPTAAGGIPGGSIVTYTDTGDRFIYDSGSGAWLPFVGEEDLLEVLEDIRDGISDLLAHFKVTRAAVATIANIQDDGSNFSTDDK